LALNDTSNAAFPVIADGFVDQTAHNYTTDNTKPGGVWQGKQAVVVKVDTSASVMKVNRTANYTITGPNGTAVAGDIFSNAASSGTSGAVWLGQANTVVNPKPYTSGGSGGGS
jgi:hypothetical protein